MLIYLLRCVTYLDMYLFAYRSAKMKTKRELLLNTIMFLAHRKRLAFRVNTQLLI